MRLTSSLRSAALLALLAACRTEPVQPQVDDVLTRRPAGRHFPTTRYPGGGFVRFGLYVPEGIDAPGRSVPLVLALHPGGLVTPFLGAEYADQLVAPALSELGAVIAAPDAATADGWSAVDDERLLWLVGELRRVYPEIDPRRVLITGYSAGGGQAWGLANRNQDVFTAAIPVSARPRQTDQSWRIPVYAIHSRDDELIPFSVVESYVAAQQAAGAPVQLHALSGVGHYQTAAFVPFLREAVSWLSQVWP